MKNFTLKLIAIALSLPATDGFAQTSKESRTIIINNGDTLVNGKKISDLNRGEREKVQKDFDEMRKRLKESQVEINGTGIIIERKSEKDGKENNIVIRRFGKEPGLVMWNNGDSTKTLRFDMDGHKGDFEFRRFKGDSLFARINIDSIRVKRYNRDSMMVKHFDFDYNSHMPVIHPPADIMEMPNAVRPLNREPRIYTAPDAFGRSRNNSQSFSYSNTDKNGITTRMNIRVSDLGKDDLKKITGNEAPSALAVEDLTLFPNFSSGKMTLSFNLSGKGSTKVKILDSDKKTVYSDEPTNFSGNYLKQISLPKNGIYYLTVNQNGKWFAKKIVKEQ